MKTINCAIIEDEPMGAKTLESMLAEYHPECKVVRYARTLAEAKETFADKSIDVFFTDVELEDGNVFLVLKNIELKAGKFIVFTTAYEEFGAKAFSYPALHYLVKPVNLNELEKAINRYHEATSEDSNNSGEEQNENEHDYQIDKLLLPTQNGTLFVDYVNIVRIQSSNKYSIVFTADKKQLIVSKPLSRFEEVLTKKGFARIHDSHIINLNHVKSYLKGKGGEIVMSDDSQVPISVRKKDALAALFKHLI